MNRKSCILHIRKIAKISRRKRPDEIRVFETARTRLVTRKSSKYHRNILTFDMIRYCNERGQVETC